MLRSLTITSIVLAYGPFFFLHGRHLWERRHYQFFPVFLLGLAGLTWSRWSGSSWELKFTRWRFVVSVTMLASGALMLVAAAVFWSPWLAAISALMVAGSNLVVSDEIARRDLVPIWFALWLLIPPPFALDTHLIQRMQRWVSRVSSEQLDLCGVNHLPLGNILAFPEKQLLVDEACSGIQSLFALIACTALYALWKRVGVLTLVVLLLGASFWAFVANVVRIVSIAVTYDAVAIDLSKGWPHEILGFVVFALALGMMMSTGVFARLLLMPFRLPASNQNVAMKVWNWLVGRSRLSVRQGNPTKVARDSTQFKSESTRMRYALVSVMVVSFMVSALQLRIAVKQLAAEDQPATPARPFELSKTITEQVFPAQQGDWKLVEYRTRERDKHSESPFSNIWTYQSPYAIAVFAFDYPYDVAHDLSACYRGIGWRVTEQRVEGSLDRQSRQSRWPYQIVECDKPLGQHGFLAFSAFRANGEPLDPPLAMTRANLGNRLVKRLFAPAPLALQQPAVYQVQLFVFSKYVLSKAERQGALEHFEHLRQIILDRHVRPVPLGQKDQHD